LFVDPIGDIAILGSPDNQELCEKANAFDELVGSITPLRTAKPGDEGWLLSLHGGWFRCTIERVGPLGPLWLSNLEGKVIGGMSGSPILSSTGKAVGIVCTSAEDDRGVAHEPHGPNPALDRNMPKWFCG
jgi:hypothetical protein